MTSPIQTNRLLAKIAARNHCHLLVKEWAPKAQALLATFQGRKVLNQGSVLPDKINEALQALLPDELQQWPRLIRFCGSYGSVVMYATARCGWKGPDWRGQEREGCETAEERICLGLTGDDLKLTTLPPLSIESYRTDWTVEAVLAARTKLTEAETAHNEAKAQPAIAYFGIYDN